MGVTPTRRRLRVRCRTHRRRARAWRGRRGDARRRRAAELVGHPGADVDERLEVDAGGDPGAVERVHEVLGREVAGRARGVGAAAEPAGGGVGDARRRPRTRPGCWPAPVRRCRGSGPRADRAGTSARDARRSGPGPGSGCRPRWCRRARPRRSRARAARWSPGGRRRRGPHPGTDSRTPSRRSRARADPRRPRAVDDGREHRQRLVDGPPEVGAAERLGGGAEDRDLVDPGRERAGRDRARSGPAPGSAPRDVGSARPAPRRRRPAAAPTAARRTRSPRRHRGRSAASRSMNPTFTSVATVPGSFWSPSRGPTSTIVHGVRAASRSRDGSSSGSKASSGVPAPPRRRRRRARAVSVPSTGAVMGCSIFMASTTSRVVPAVTCVPTSTVRR